MATKKEEVRENPKTETAIVKRPSQAKLGIIPTQINDAMTIATQLARSALVPERYRDKPQDALAAIMWGAELGVPPMSALKGIAVIKGNPSLYGDLFLSVIMSHPEFEDFEEVETGKDTDDWKWTCTFWRKGKKPISRSYSKKDAVTAKLWGKTGDKGPTPWVTNPGRMLQFRARGFAGRDRFADALAGLVIKEEAEDMVVLEGSDGSSAEIIMPRRMENGIPGTVIAQPEAEPPLTPRSYTEEEVDDKAIEDRAEYVHIWEQIKALDSSWKPDPGFASLGAEERSRKIQLAKDVLQDVQEKAKTKAQDILDLVPEKEETPKVEPPEKPKSEMSTAEKHLGPVANRVKPKQVLTGEYDRIQPMHVKKLHVILRSAELHTEKELYEKLWENFGIESSKDIPRSEYKRVLKWAGGDKFKIE
jgi:hypothetical protein